jgi:hypothetical protein
MLGHTQTKADAHASALFLGVPAFTGEKELFLGLSSSYATYLKNL